MTTAQVFQGTWEELSTHAGAFGKRQLTLLAPLDADAQDDAPATKIAELAMASGSFHWLAAEPDLYDETCGEPV